MWVSRRHGFCFGVLPSQFLVLEWWNFLLFDDTNREFEAVVWIASGLALGTTTSLFEKRRLRRQRLGAASRSLSSSSRWGILGEYGNTSSFFRRYKCNTVTGACLKWCAVYFSLHDLLKSNYFMKSPTRALSRSCELWNPCAVFVRTRLWVTFVRKLESKLTQMPNATTDRPCSINWNLPCSCRCIYMGHYYQYTVLSSEEVRVC